MLTDTSIIRLIASYVVGCIILVVAGYMLITTGQVPEQWMTLVTGFAGFVFIADGVARTIRVYTARKE